MYIFTLYIIQIKYTLNEYINIPIYIRMYIENKVFSRISDAMFNIIYLI